MLRVAIHACKMRTGLMQLPIYAPWQVVVLTQVLIIRNMQVQLGIPPQVTQAIHRLKFLITQEQLRHAQQVIREHIQTVL